MNVVIPFTPPTISDKDLGGASSLLRIHQNSLFGEARLKVATCMESFDVTACPGSGKTTLLVAKLAILASKWKHSTRGICVLSHTNVARREIETCLGNTSLGRSLFSYPHFVGTIHGFVNEFLALPWLRSKGYPIKQIDSDLVLNRRWKSLNYATRAGLERNKYNRYVLTIKSPDFGVGSLRSGKRTLSVESPTYQEITKICRASTKRGYFCYDEMFVWANELLVNVRGMRDALRYRFPFVFVDEAQDNSEEQSAILHRIFVAATDPVICQRFGDENQAIFDSLQTQGAETNRFPNKLMAIEVANSHRFGQSIANIAKPLAAVPLLSGLKGIGPKNVLRSGKTDGTHTIFLIDQHSTKKILDSYGDLIVQTFSTSELSEGTFFAVGQIHRPPDEEKTHKHPHHLGHYWPDYNPAFCKSEPTPNVFVQYVSLGRGKAKLEGECCFAVEKIAEGILRLACEGKGDLSIHRHRHRQVLELLEHSDAIQNKYKDLIVAYAVEKEDLTEDSWKTKWRKIVREISEAIAQTTLSGASVDAFLSWENNQHMASMTSVTPLNDGNIYRYPKDNPLVHIHLGSIHSVKGQTHSATLVLETFWKSHCLEKLLPWLLGERVGWKPGDGVEQMKRMQLHYVAMTRPTHLLCLAIKRSSLEDVKGNLDSIKTQTLKKRGWQIEDLTRK